MQILKIIALCGVLSILGGAAFAGAVEGPTDHDDTVEEGKIDVYRIRFTGGEKAMVRAKAHGDDIDLYIYDTHDNLIEKDVDDDDVPVCIWTPKWTGEFKVKIVNNESRSVDYKLETN
ncbi:hypothetical protein IAD21_04979 [Abditibacteriota bacterium]|nr:hypothetical protein IAD21_04979 [Abditibacteriota bacterium]